MFKVSVVQCTVCDSFSNIVNKWNPSCLCVSGVSNLNHVQRLFTPGPAAPAADIQS